MFLNIQESEISLCAGGLMKNSKVYLRCARCYFGNAWNQMPLNIHFLAVSSDLAMSSKNTCSGQKVQYLMPSVTPEGFVLVGGLGSFQQKGNYIFWESLPGMVRAGSVAVGQMQKAV